MDDLLLEVILLLSFVIYTINNIRITVAVLFRKLSFAFSSTGAVIDQLVYRLSYGVND